MVAQGRMLQRRHGTYAIASGELDRCASMGGRRLARTSNWAWMLLTCSALPHMNAAPTTHLHDNLPFERLPRAASRSQDIPCIARTSPRPVDHVVRISRGKGCSSPQPATGPIGALCRRTECQRVVSPYGPCKSFRGHVELGHPSTDAFRFLPPLLLRCCSTSAHPDVDSGKVNIVPSGTDLDHIRTESAEEADKAIQRARAEAERAQKEAKDLAQKAKKQAGKAEKR